MSTANLRDTNIGSVKAKVIETSLLYIDNDSPITKFSTEINSETPSNYTIVSEAAIVEKYPEEEEDIYDITLTGPFAPVNVTNGLRVIRTGNAIIINILGSVGNTNTGSSPITLTIANESFTTLPLMYRPLYTVYIPFIGQNTTIHVPCELQIGTDGVMVINNLEPGIYPNFTASNCGVYNSSAAYSRI